MSVMNSHQVQGSGCTVLGIRVWSCTWDVGKAAVLAAPPVALWVVVWDVFVWILVPASLLTCRHLCRSGCQHSDCHPECVMRDSVTWVRWSL